MELQTSFDNYVANDKPIYIPVQPQATSQTSTRDFDEMEKKYALQLEAKDCEIQKLKGAFEKVLNLCYKGKAFN